MSYAKARIFGDVAFLRLWKLSNKPYIVIPLEHLRYARFSVQEGTITVVYDVMEGEQWATNNTAKGVCEKSPI